MPAPTQSRLLPSVLVLSKFHHFLQQFSKAQGRAWAVSSKYKREPMEFSVTESPPPGSLTLWIL